MPLLPLPQVAAPALAAVPLAQLGLVTTKLPLLSAVMRLPTWSPAWVPTRLLLLLTAPLISLLPLPQVTAPAWATVPLTQLGLPTT